MTMTKDNYCSEPAHNFFYQQQTFSEKFVGTKQCHEFPETHYYGNSTSSSVPNYSYDLFQLVLSSLVLITTILLVLLFCVRRFTKSFLSRFKIRISLAIKGWNEQLRKGLDDSKSSPIPETKVCQSSEPVLLPAQSGLSHAHSQHHFTTQQKTLAVIPLENDNSTDIPESESEEDNETADISEEDIKPDDTEEASKPSQHTGIRPPSWTIFNRLGSIFYSPFRHRASEKVAEQGDTTLSNDLQSASAHERDILRQTQHCCWAGDGILASQQDLNVSLQEFAAGCGLIQAAARGDIPTMEFLLDERQKYRPPSHVNFRDYDRRTALHVAASEGRLKVCKLLLEKYHARVNRSDRWGGTPLDDAYRHRQDHVIQYLREKGALTGSRNRSINLIQACADGDLEEVQLLLSLEEAAVKAQNSLRRIKQQKQRQKLDLNRGNHDKRTALHFAASQGNIEITKLLLEKGADANVIDRHGQSPLDDALDGGHQDCVVLLSTYGSMRRGRSRCRSNAGFEKASHLLLNTNMEIDYSELEMIKRIGAGSFGAIYKCRWRGTLVAAKIIKTAQIQHDWLQSQMTTKSLLIRQDDSMSEADASIIHRTERDMALNDFRKEIELVKSFRHPNIALMLAYSTTKRHECLIFELCKCSLLDLLREYTSRGARLSKRTQFVYAQQLAQGMNYLHTCNPSVIHRDLKPANILIDYSGSLKISDFGLSKIRPNPGKMTSDVFEMTGETGSYRYMAPEVFRHEQYDEHVDIYSFAMILYYMMTGHPPWASLPGFEAVRLAAERMERPVIPQRDIDARSSNLLVMCWHSDPSVRPSFRKILAFVHNYMEDVFQSDINNVATALSTDIPPHKWFCAIL